MKQMMKLAAAGIVLMCLPMSAQASEPLSQAQLQKLFPGTFAAVVHGMMKLTVTAKGNGILIGQMPGRQDEGRWSLRDGKLCIMLSDWTRGKSACSTVIAEAGWYRGQGVKFRKI